MLIIQLGMNNVCFNENLALAVIWDPTGTKVLQSSLVALDSQADS